MAEIDKALPNVDETIEVVQDEMVQEISEPENRSGSSEVIENEKRQSSKQPGHRRRKVRERAAKALVVKVLVVSPAARNRKRQ